MIGVPLLAEIQTVIGAQAKENSFSNCWCMHLYIIIQQTEVLLEGFNIQSILHQS